MQDGGGGDGEMGKLPRAEGKPDLGLLILNVSSQVLVHYLKYKMPRRILPLLTGVRCAGCLVLPAVGSGIRAILLSR